MPEGNFNKVYVLAASGNGDQQATFKVGKTSVAVTVEDWGGFIGQWDTRLWKPKPEAVTEGGGRLGAPKHQVPLRKDYAVSANHEDWNLKSGGTPDWSPKYPEDYIGLRPGYIKPATLAWYVSHHHTAQGLNQPYQYSYLFVYALDVPLNAKTITLPDSPNIRIMGISVATEEPAVTPAQPLFDTLNMSTKSDYVESAKQ